MYKNSSVSTVLLIMCILFILCFGFAGGCTNPSETIRILEQQGYTEIEITGWRPLMAGERDCFSTGFRAKSPNGSTITGAVTAGLMKGNTIRLD